MIILDIACIVKTREQFTGIGQVLTMPLCGNHVLRLVPATGFEPVRCYSLEPESSASANSATRATAITMPILN